jgi:rod shape-determining protein MreD
MRSAVWTHLDLTARKLTPFLVTVVLVVLNFLPAQLPGYAEVSPNLALMAVYYWALHRPNLLPATAVFVIGLLQDFLSGGTVGFNATILVLVFMVAFSQRRFFYGKSFLVVWWGFMMVSLGVAVVGWLLACVLFATLLDPGPAMFEGLMNAAAYPVLGWLFVQIHRTLPRYE